MRRPGQIAALAVAALLIAGCSKPVTKDELVGAYVARWDFGTEVLTLRSDGHYWQQFTPKDEHLPHAINYGRWEFDGRQLKLDNALLVHDGFGDFNPKYAEKTAGVSLFTVTKRWGVVRILASANAEVYYARFYS